MAKPRPGQACEEQGRTDSPGRNYQQGLEHVKSTRSPLTEFCQLSPQGSLGMAPHPSTSPQNASELIAGRAPPQREIVGGTCVWPAAVRDMHVPQPKTACPAHLFSFSVWRGLAASWAADTRRCSGRRRQLQRSRQAEKISGASGRATQHRRRRSAGGPPSRAEQAPFPSEDARQCHSRGSTTAGHWREP